jgi:hypothetical protein
VIVSPVTIATRFGPYPAGPAADGGLPAAVDVRQASLLGSAWTATALKHIAEAGAASVTWYETAGWRGIVERDAGSPDASFPSVPGQAFPLYHVLADAGGWAGGTVRDARSSDPLVAEALAIDDGGGTHLLVANLTPGTVDVRIDGLADGPLFVSMLDAGSFRDATREPEAFRAARGAMQAVASGVLDLQLRPYAVARVNPA